MTVLSELTITVFPANGEAVNGNIYAGYAGCVGVADPGFLASQFSVLVSSAAELMQLPADSLPILLTYDVLIGQKADSGLWGPDGGGVHESTPGVGGGSQTWVWATYNGGLQDANNKGYCRDSQNNQITCAYQDVADLSHELGEWADDPYGHTPAPCENGLSNLEVGDPLDGTSHYYIYMGANNNYPYHLQDLVFLPYFGAPTSLSYGTQLNFQSQESISYCSNGG